MLKRLSTCSFTTTSVISAFSALAEPIIFPTPTTSHDCISIPITILIFEQIAFQYIAIEDLKFYQSLVKPHLGSSLIRKNNTVYSNRTTISPFFKSGLWIVNRSAVNLKRKGHEFELLKSSLDDYYERREVLADSACWIMRLYPHDKKYLLFIFYADISLQEKGSNFNLASLEEYLINEQNGVFSTFRSGEFYKRDSLKHRQFFENWSVDGISEHLD